MTTEVVLKAVKEHADTTADALKEVHGQIQVIKQALAGADADIETRAKRKNIFAQVAKSAELDALRTHSSKVARIPTQASIKSLVNDNSEGNIHFDTQAQRYGSIANDARKRLTLLDVIGSIPVAASSFEFVSLDGYSIAADYQTTQGSKKAVQETATDLKTANIVTIASLQKASTQVLADAPTLASFLQNRMSYDALAKLEGEILGGVGGAGKIDGLLNQATTFTAEGDKLPDQLGEAIAGLDAAGWSANAIIMHPSVWQAMRSERATDGIYVAGGWSQPSAPSVWGVPVITNAFMPIDEVLVIDTEQLLLLDRQQPVFEIGYSGDDFDRNLLTMRTELRAGLAVLAPSAVLKLTVA